MFIKKQKKKHVQTNTYMALIQDSFYVEPKVRNRLSQLNSNMYLNVLLKGRLKHVPKSFPELGPWFSDLFIF